MVKPNWDSIQLYFSGDDYFQDVLRSIECAKDEVIIESYTFDMDPIGLRILSALTKAQERGVRIQILVDGIGSFNWAWSLREYCDKNHLHLRIYHPIPLQFEFIKKMSWRSLRRILFLLRKTNKRNHRKVILVDKKIAFVGSLNISQVHTKEFMESKAWRDTGIRITGGPLPELRKACLEAWVTARAERLLKPLSFLRRRSRPIQKSDAVIRLNSKIRWRYSLLRDLNRRLQMAEKRILITNAYFLPRRSVLRSLMRAAQRGVYTGICIPSISDVPPVRWASRSLYNRLIRAGVHIFEYQQKMLHAKTLVIDDWATVGSHNLNHRSLTHDLEVEVVLNQPPWVGELVQQWSRDIQHSKEITSKEIGKLTWFDRSMTRLAYWFRYWL